MDAATERMKLLQQDPRVSKLVERLQSAPGEGAMSREEIENWMELVKIFERKYLDSFLENHPDFPAKAATRFLSMYDIGPFPPGINDLEEISIPCQMPHFVEWEFRVSLILSASGCSERMISEFLHRDRGTVRKYLEPVQRVAELWNTLDEEERKKQMAAVIENIIEDFTKRRAKSQ